MANTHGFEIVIQASKNVIVKALKGAWKSANCPVEPGEDGRIPEFLDVIIPPGGLSIGGYDIIDGHVQIPQDELNAEFAPDVNGTKLIVGLNIQLEIGNPPIPSAQLLDFHSVLHAKAPIGTLPNTLDVGILLANMLRTNVWAVLDQGHPLDSKLEELLADYVDQAYVNEDIPHLIAENGVSFIAGTCNTSTQIFDDESNINRQILTSFPNPNTLQISIPIYLRMFAFSPASVPLLGTIASPMGIETRIIINAPFEKQLDKYIAKFGEVIETNITVGAITGAGSDIAGNPNEANNYVANKTMLLSLTDLDSLLSAQLKSKGVQFAKNLGNRTINVPSTTAIENLIADQFFNELLARQNIALWTPTASNAQFMVNSVEVKVISNTLNIALNNAGGGDSNAITNFIPVNMEFSIALSKQSLDTKIQRSIVDNGFNNFPKRFVEDGKDVDLNSLKVSVIDFAIRLEGTVTVIDAVLGSIDVDASFRTDVGLHWQPSGSLNTDGFQALKHHEIGESDVDVDEGIAFWIVAIILTIVSFGVGGVFVGIISIIVILIVKSIVENIGSDSLVNGVSGAIDGITAWPPNLSRIGRVKAVFFDPVEISSTGLVISGIFEVISSCETVQVVPATTAGSYTTKATQPTELKALKTYSSASYFWNPGDGSGTQPLQMISHTYESSGIYVAKHGVEVNVAGGAKSRHFALVKVENIPPTVNAGNDIEVNEGEVVNLEAYFEDAEYTDKHTSIWNFGDNQPLKMGIIEETNLKPKAIGVSKVQHAWCDQGEYYVCVQIIDNDGGIGTDTKKVTVKNVIPIVTTPERIYAYPCSPLTLIGNFIDPGWCDKHTATWCFGDCSMTKMAIVEETNEAPAAQGKATASNTYKKCGSYYSECTVTDDDGGIGKANTIVEVIELKNPFFNDGFTYNLFGKIANFWNPFINVTSGDNPLFANSSLNINTVEKGSELFSCEKCLVFDGISSQRIKTSQLGFTGIYQSFGSNPDWEYQIGVLFQLNGTNAVVKLGLDSMGLTDPTSTNIVWSEGRYQNQWSHLLQRVIARSDKVTIFLGILNTDNNLVDCCFDCVELIAMQNTKCSDYQRPTPKKSICIDFKDVNQKQELPSEWAVNGLKFLTTDGMANRITTGFAPDYMPSLEIRKGLIIEFNNLIEKISFEFSYNKYLLVVMTFSDSDGKVLLRNDQELKGGKTVIHAGINKAQRVHLYVRGDGAISKICFK